MSHQNSSLLDPVFCAQLEQLRIVSRHRVLGTESGQRTSHLLGSSLEFADYRSYAPGDDIRQVDWNAYARLGKWFLKMFLDEREIKLHLLIDTSRSMGFGQPSKGRMAPAGSLAALGYIALHGTDRVGVVSFRDQVVGGLPTLRVKEGFGDCSPFWRRSSLQGRVISMVPLFTRELYPVNADLLLC